MELQVAKKWYDYLAKGKIMAMKCMECGTYNFPPVTACKECGSTNQKWVRISGEGELISYSATILPAKKFAKLGRIPYGMVKLKEGPIFFTKIEGVNVSTPEKIKEGNEKLPMRVRAKIKKVEGMNIVVFKV